LIGILHGVATLRQKLTGVHDMSYRVFKHNTEFGPRPGLEGPFHYPNGQVLYYDPKAGEYWDPKTDWYVEREDVARLQQSIFDRISA
jgi:hypothetical protein